MEKALGQILLQDRIVAQSQLMQALEHQRELLARSRQRLLGEILVDSGVINHQTLKIALERQAMLYETQFFPLQHHPSVRSRFKRALDICGAIVGLAIVFPFLPIVALIIVFTSPGPVFLPQYRVGLRGKQFKYWVFRTRAWQEPSEAKLVHQRSSCEESSWLERLLHRTRLDKLLQLLNVLRGEMSLVGVCPPALDEVRSYTRQEWQRLAVKPGLLGLWNLRQYRDKHHRGTDLDGIYARRWCQRLDFAIIFQAIAQGIPGLPWVTHMPAPAKVPILNLEIDNLSKDQLLRRVDQGVVFTPNVDHLMKLQRDQDFYQIYRQADFKTCDSQILIYASRFLGKPIRERVSGSDFFPDFCQFHQYNKDIRIFLLGGVQGVAEKAQGRVNRRIGRQIIVGTCSPSFGFMEDPQECQEIVAHINQYQPTVIAVGLGAPNQEKWIYLYRNQLPSVKIFLAIGATIDFEAGYKRRAPQWASNLGLEWLYRLISEPRRLWRRYLIDDIPFIWLLIKQKCGFYTSPFMTHKPLHRSQAQRLKSTLKK